MSMGSWSSGQRISWESSSSLPWFLYTSSDFTREFALTQEGNHFHRRFEWTWFGTEAKSYVMALGSAQVPVSQIFCLQSPAQVYKGNDLCWNWRCDFSWVTGSSSLTNAMSPRARWYGPGEWLLSPRSRILQCSNSRSCGLHFVVPAGCRTHKQREPSCLDGPAKPAHCPNHWTKVMTPRARWWAASQQS